MSDKLSSQEIVKLAAEAGAKAAMETLEKERQRDRRDMADRRLRNTKLLLRNYRIFRAHAENAVFDIDEIITPEEIIADLMMPGRDTSAFVESIKLSAARTATIVKHIELMMKLFQNFCFTLGTDEDQRRWRVVNELYIRDLAPGERPATIQTLAKEENVVDRTIYKDIDIAAERIAAYMFGIDGVKRH